MQLSQDHNQGDYRIQSYQPGDISINTTHYTHSVIVSPQTLILDWPPQHIDDLQPEHWQPILALDPEIVLLGTGSTHRFLSAERLAPLIERQIGAEVMDTRAACRTFTVLASEERHVVAALLL